MKYIVYKTTNKINKKIYIGVHLTKDPDVFDGYIGCGISSANQCNREKCRGLHAAVAKYGYENFEREVLFVFDATSKGERLAYKKEEELVTKAFIKRSDTYNLVEGGKYSHPNTKIVYQFDLSGNLIKVWDSITEAATYYNVSNTAIRNCCVDLVRQSAGYHWSFTNIFKMAKSKNFTAVAKYDDAGKFLASYDSLNEAALDNNIGSTANIIAAIKGVTQKRCGGFRWRYFEGDVSDIEPLK